MKLLVLGYYDKQNMGDDAFKEAIPLILGSCHEYTFQSVSSALEKNNTNINNNINEYDGVLCGAGDIVVEYFLERFQVLLQNYQRGPVILFGAGITWPSTLQKKFLQGFDLVFLRNTSDLVAAQLSIQSTKRVHYIPDLVFALPSTAKKIDTSKKAGVFLISSLLNNNTNQQKVIEKIAQAICHVAKTHNVEFVRFNTSDSEKEDDLKISLVVKELCEKMSNQKTNNTFSINTTVCGSPQEMLALMSTFHVNICMRFHSHVFSIVQNVPFVSLSLTRKVTLLLQETGLGSQMSVPLDYDASTLCPTDFSLVLFQQVFDSLMEEDNYEKAKCSLQNVYQQRHDFLTQENLFGTLLQESVQNFVPLTKRLPFLPVNNRDEKVQSTIEKAWQWHDELFGPNATNTKAIWTKEEIRQKMQVIAERIGFAITNRVGSKYIWGLVENLVKDSLLMEEYIRWIYHDFHSQSNDVVCNNVNSFNQNSDGKFWFQLFGQTDFNGSHRAGWEFATHHLQSLQSESGVFMDLCMDRTFHWGSDVLQHNGILPYTHAWVGFLHHTFLEDYTDYNVKRMLENPLFHLSMQTCKGIFVMSKELERLLHTCMKEYFVPKNIPIPLIQYVSHPMETVPKTKWFTPQKFLLNEHKKLVQIGSWMRDTFGIYELALADIEPVGFTEEVTDTFIGGSRKKRHELQKCFLQSKNMNFYTPPAKVYACTEPCCFLDQNGNAELDLYLSSRQVEDVTTENQKPCKNSHLETKLVNKWMVGLQHYIETKVMNAVQPLTNLTNEEYDCLLENNIVFLKLYDVAACNTLLECMVRNTPLLVNPLPEIVNVLGKDYPFYYSNVKEALTKSQCFDTIAKTSAYLKKMDKKQLNIDSFLHDIAHGPICQSIFIF